MDRFLFNPRNGNLRCIPVEAAILHTKESFSTSGSAWYHTTWTPNPAWWVGDRAEWLDYVDEGMRVWHCGGSPALSCHFCGGQYLDIGSFSGGTRFCSNACQRAQYNKNLQAARALKRPSRAKERLPVDCEHCQRSFTPKRNDAKFCSSGCRVKQHRQLALDEEVAANLARWVSREIRGVNQSTAINKVIKKS